MAGATVLVVGGGFGGLAAAHALRARLDPQHRVVVVEKSPTFSLGLSLLWLMTGERADPREGQRDLATLAARGIEWVRGEVLELDPQRRAVATTAGWLQADFLVVALGADLAPHQVPGFPEAALNLYDTDGALQARAALEAVDRGRVVVLVSRTPFKCPAAPYEAAFLIDALLRRRGVRARVEVALYTPEAHPMPVAGPAVGRALRELLESRGIEYHPEQTVLRVDGGRRRVLFEVEETAYDVLVGVPPHVAPAVVRGAGLVDGTGWVPVDPGSLRTSHAGVFAIGDVTAIRLRNGMLLPKAGVFAEAQAAVVAEQVAAELAGRTPDTRFDGKGFCYVEVGDGLAAFGSGDFYADPAPRVRLNPPSAQYRKEKEAFERDRLAAWL